MVRHTLLAAALAMAAQPAAADPLGDFGTAMKYGLPLAAGREGNRNRDLNALLRWDLTPDQVVLRHPHADPLTRVDHQVRGPVGVHVPFGGRAPDPGLVEDRLDEGSEAHQRERGHAGHGGARPSLRRPRPAGRRCAGSAR